jgi:glycosyltransferase involved in cell wall biosynthesis
MNSEATTTQCPLVTIALPLYNAGSTIQAALHSILLQTYKNWELIIIDDGSTDNGPAIIESISDPRIMLVRDGVNRGISFRLNQALRLGKGYYFARMDADDISFSQRIEKQVKFMQTNPSVDLLATGVLFFKNDGSIQGIMPVKTTHTQICQRPWNGFYMPHPTWLGRMEWFKHYGYNSCADKAEDQELLFRSYQKSHFDCLPDVLLAYRQDQRSFKKMLAARYVFAKSFCCISLNRKQYYLFAKILLIQCIKVVADFISIVFDVKGCRNKLADTPSNTCVTWQKTWEKVNKHT